MASTVNITPPTTSSYITYYLPLSQNCGKESLESGNLKDEEDTNRMVGGRKVSAVGSG
jgi:hypothetical protein